MMRIFTLLLATLCTSLVFSHHSIVSEYPANPGLKMLSGTVTRVRWHAPHVEIYIAAEGGIGTGGAQWIVNSHAPGVLARTYAIVKEDVVVGNTVAFVGWPDKFDVPRYHIRAMSINGGPMRSTHRPSDRRALEEGTLGQIVPAPGLDVDETYGGSIAGAQTEVKAQSQTAAPANSGRFEVGAVPVIWIAAIVALLLAGFGWKMNARSG